MPHRILVDSAQSSFADVAPSGLSRQGIDTSYDFLSAVAVSQGCWARSSSEIRCCGSYLSILLSRSVKLATSSAEILGKGVIFSLIASSVKVWLSDCSVKLMPAHLSDGKESQKMSRLFLMNASASDEAGFSPQDLLDGFSPPNFILTVGRLIRSASMSLINTSNGNSSTIGDISSGLSHPNRSK